MWLKSHLVEVKGSYEDLAREDLDNKTSKWARTFGHKHELWLAVGDIKTATVATVDVPEHWGIALFLPEKNAPKIMRRPGRSDQHSAVDPFVVHAFRAIAEVNTAARLPKFFNDRRVPLPWQRLNDANWAEEVVDSSDNNQMSLFMEK